MFKCLIFDETAEYAVDVTRHLYADLENPSTVSIGRKNFLMAELSSPLSVQFVPSVGVLGSSTSVRSVLLLASVPCSSDGAFDVSSSGNI